MKRKKEFFVFGILILILSVAAAVALLCRKDGNRVVITNGESVTEYALDCDQTVTLAHNTVVIENGCVYMAHSDCKNQVCVKTGKISKNGEKIICLPNCVAVEVKNES